MARKLIGLAFLFALTLAGCRGQTPDAGTATQRPTQTIPSSTPSPVPTRTATHTPTNTPTSTRIPTETFTPTTTPTPTPTPMPTLAPDEAEAMIRWLLQDANDCPAPCFWGIVPGETTLDEAKRIFAHLGLRPQFTVADGGKEFYAVMYEFDDGISITSILGIRDGIIVSLTVSITPETYQPGEPRQWSAYSPETLIARYGAPSRVDFWIGRAAGPRVYSMVMYFNEVNLIIESGGPDLDIIYNEEKLLFRVCLLMNQIYDVSIWMGKNPEYPPLGAVPLEEATSLTLEEFADLMLGNPEDACIDLKNEAFP